MVDTEPTGWDFRCWFLSCHSSLAISPYLPRGRGLFTVWLDTGNRYFLRNILFYRCHSDKFAFCLRWDLRVLNVLRLLRLGIFKVGQNTFLIVSWSFVLWTRSRTLWLQCEMPPPPPAHVFSSLQRLWSLKAVVTSLEWQQTSQAEGFWRSRVRLALLWVAAGSTPDHIASLLEWIEILLSLVYAGQVFW